ncbi:DUF58 domain-containing protein [Aquihabitans sp. McL0605]|uniref:DUF58 domain-containing protein n=1 Tax=Aquihabitans sp. McL0605 TaxID=3415671 RepID=UPI003CE70324
MLTKPGWLVACGAVIAALAGRLFGVEELFVMAAIAGALLVVALLSVRRRTPTVTIVRRLNPHRVTVGALARVELAISNRTTTRVPPISLVDPVEGTIGARLSVGPFAPGDRQDVGYRLPTARRGLLHIGPLDAELVDPFGLARRSLGGPDTLVITVLPAIDPAPALPMGGGRHEPLPGMSRRLAATAGVDDLVTLRPYVVGDDLRRVHWPSTAHSDELQVRRDEERWQGHLTLLLDARSGVLGAADFERAISAAAGVVHSIAESGDRVRLADTGGTDSGMVDARRGAHALMEDLALVDQHAAEEVALPHADPRRPTPLVLLTGRDPSGLVAGLVACGFPDLTVVRFVADDGGQRPPGRVVTVLPGETFAGAWARQVVVHRGAAVPR